MRARQGVRFEACEGLAAAKEAELVGGERRWLWEGKGGSKDRDKGRGTSKPYDRRTDGRGKKPPLKKKKREWRRQGGEGMVEVEVEVGRGKREGWRQKAKGRGQVINQSTAFF